MPTTLILGGSGFIGSHLADRLLAEGHHIVCFDSMITGQRSNIEHLIENPQFQLMERDITDTLWVIGADIDYVLHLASPASPKDYIKYPIETLMAGSVGTFHAVRFAQNHDAKLILASTSEVYGDPTISPQTEDYWGNVNPTGERSVYDEAKRFSESVVAAYRRYYGVDSRIVRLFNTFGTRMKLNDGRAVPNFAAQAFRGLPLTIYGDGSQTRSFTYVDDTVDGIWRMMNHTATTHPLPLVNLGNPDEVSILQVAEEIIELTNSRSEIVFKPLPEDDPTRRKPDIHKARNLLGWEPKTSRIDGLEKTLPYFEELVYRS
jgi:dTDP-glucose 4,6-dehydratase